MKRLVAVLSGLLVLPAFAEVMPVFYDEEIEYVDGDVAGVDTALVEDDVVESTQKVNAPVGAPVNVNARNGATRSTSRAVASGNSTTATRGNTAGSRGVATRAGTVSRAATTTNNVSTRNNVVSRASVSRAAVTSTTKSTSNATPSRAATTARAGQTTGTTGVATRRGTTSATNTARAGTTSLVQTDTVNTPLYTGRVGVRGVATRVPTTRAASAIETTTTTTATVTDTTSLDELAQLTDFCKAQYMQCMDSYCNTLDDSQGRCSCSANLKNYEKIENALKQATADLQSLAQNIQYLGLSADQVTTLFQETEAEAAMQGKTDTSQLKTDLEKIRGLIIDVKSGTSTSSTASTSDLSIDVSGLLEGFSFDNNSFDLSSLFGGMSSSGTKSIANQRGEQLYKTAAARCKTSVLNSCVEQGVDASVITNSYDLEIDKQCMAYERSLTDANDQMRSTVSNAQNMLQRARLLVSNQKNAYDLRGCVTALDECMQDDFVCGDDYKNCLDPSGRYIVNGTVVVGSTPGKVGTSATQDGLYSTWKYDGTKDPWSATDDGLANYVQKTMEQFDRTSASTDMSLFLQNKIGYIDNSNNKAIGMCAGVLNKCQDYTFNRSTAGKLTYNKENTVVKEFLQRAMMQIKASQDTVISEYAQNCPQEVKTCLARNSYSNTVSSSNSQLMDVAIASCSSLITTCMSVNGQNSYNTTTGQRDWVNKLNLAPVCPDGKSTGTYPNCVCETGKVYLASYNVCAKTGVSCDKVSDGGGGTGISGIWPECSGCKKGTFDVESGTCKE